MKKNVGKALFFWWLGNVIVALIFLLFSQSDTNIENFFRNITNGFTYICFWLFLYLWQQGINLSTWSGEIKCSNCYRWIIGTEFCPYCGSKVYAETYFFSTPSTATTVAADTKTNFTIEDLNKIVETLFPTLYYGLSNFVKEGEFFLIKKTDMNPEWIVVHPNDFEIVKEQLGKVRTLVPIKEYKTDYSDSAKFYRNLGEKSLSNMNKELFSHKDEE